MREEDREPGSIGLPVRDVVVAASRRDGEGVRPPPLPVRAADIVVAYCIQMRISWW
jgi:hypothetical protein